MHVFERRAHRSGESPLALRFQLESTRHRGNLEALVLCNDEGLPLASAGEGAVCAELAAVAPFLGRGHFGMPLPPMLQGAEVAVRQFLRLVLAIDEFGAHLRNGGLRLSRTEMLVLVRVYIDGPISNNELARRMRMGRSSMNALVTRLLQDGILEAHPDPQDGRRRSLSVTTRTRDRVWKYFVDLYNASPTLVDPRSGHLEPMANRVVEGLRLLLQRVSRP